MADETDRDDPDYGLPKGKEKAEFLREMRGRYKAASEAVASLYDRARDDMKFAFVPDEQWDAWMAQARGDRPMYTFNRLRQAIKQVTNDQRQNRPQVKVRPWEESDRDLAEIRQGLLRSIESQSNAGLAYDEAFKFAVGGGYGCWRIRTEYADDDTFDQDVLIEPVFNPYAVKFDPDARKRDRSDGRYAFVEQRFARQEFKARWPKAELVAFNAEHDWTPEWCDESTLLVVEYWYVETEHETIRLLDDGQVVDESQWKAMGKPKSVQDRQREKRTVWSCLCSGADVLEKTRWPGKFIPLVPTWGDILNVDGKDEFCGMVQFSRDAQQAYNFQQSVLIETLAEQPRSPIMATPKQIQGHEPQYENIGTRNDPVLLYNPDERVPGGRPMREPPPAFPAALANAAALAAEDIKATSGKFDASLGARSNETSGRAIALRQREGDVSSFDYIDNLTYSLRHSFEIINDLIPHIYDTERQVRILGDDMAEKIVRVNQMAIDPATGQWVRDPATDITTGKYDLAVTVGPSFTTQRMEMADAMQALTNDPTPFGLIAKYGFLKALDAPGMDDLLKGARKLLVKQGLLEPAEGDQPPAPPQPNPKDVADAKAKEASAQLNVAKAEGQTLQNQADALALGVQMGMAGVPPPIPPQSMAPNQPPQGGFFVPAVPPQGTAPGGFPG